MINVVHSRVNEISDTILYQEARAFVRDTDMPSKKQLNHLNGLAAMGKNWSDLRKYIDHQRNRDTLPKECKAFYDALWHYFYDSQQGLTQRIQTDLQLVNVEGLAKNARKQAVEAWAQELAQEFITHLLAEALIKQV